MQEKGLEEREQPGRAGSCSCRMGWLGRKLALGMLC